MAKLVNVATNTLGRYEKGDTYPTIDTIEQLARVLNVKAELLYDEHILFMLNLPEEILSIRTTLNLSAKDLGLRVGIRNARTVREWQSGKRIPNTNITRLLFKLKKAAT